jgi:hypothetical protein
MAEKSRNIISVNWRGLAAIIANLIKFIKWPASLIIITYLILSIPNYSGGLNINYDLLLKYIDVIIWPLVVVGALWFIRPNIPDLLARIEELTFLGNYAKFAKNKKQSTDSQANELNDIDPSASKPTTKKQEDFQITDDDTHALLTTYEAAIAYIQVYAIIFGTQINVLRRLADYTDGLSADSLKDILEDHKTRSKGKVYTDILPFMEFLLHNTLVLYDAKTQTYQLTNAGYYFLVYLHKAGLLDGHEDL